MKKNIILILLVLMGDFCLFGQKYISGIKNWPNNPVQKNVSIDCDTIFSFPTSDPVPGGLTFDGSCLYSRGISSYLIYKFNLFGQVSGTLPDPWDGSGDIDFDGTYLWVVSEQQAKLYKIDSSNGNILSSFNLPTSNSSDPNDWGCAYDNGYIWTTEYIDKTLMRINCTTGALVDSFAIHRSILPLKNINGDLYGIEFDLENPFNPKQLDKFDKNTGAVIDSVPWCLSNPLGFISTGENLWGLSNETKRIYEFDSLFLSVSKSGLHKKNISVYPNPSSNFIYIRNDNRQKLNMQIFNLLGICIYETNLFGYLNEMNIRNLMSGQFLIKFTGNNWTEQIKFIKN